MTTVSTSRDVMIDPFGEDTEPISKICKTILGKPSAQTVWRWSRINRGNKHFHGEA
ncbi:hypothetical protein CA54_40710 [Symmachiella macrocystis]|uniref:Uncharacterized protein n=1 Tax=Symmachiella macrocystis TaxID=2527985 RepID=A0A5C6BEE9_9PLAN|nr:hypothetical protein [Symmachiella macrocystis]TWU08834.1 hypothetical protein CA54_40710 [Symmachiella macrocystis]